MPWDAGRTDFWTRTTGQQGSVLWDGSTTEVDKGRPGVQQEYNRGSLTGSAAVA